MQDFGDGVGGRVYRAQLKAMGRYIQGYRTTVPKWLLWLHRNPITINKAKRDPTLIHTYCCDYYVPDAF